MHVAPASSQERRLQRPAEALFLVSGSALAAFLFAHTFVEAHTFFQAQTGSLLTEQPWIPIAFVASLGWLLLKSSLESPRWRFLPHVWLAVGLAGAAHAALATRPHYTALAFLTLLPAWIRLPLWAKEVLTPRVRRIGSIREWLGVAGVMALALCTTIIAQGLCVLLRYPSVDFAFADMVGIAARVAAYAAIAAAAVVSACLLSRLLVGERSRAVSLSGFAFVVALATTIAALLLNAARAVAYDWASPRNVLFAIAIAAPPAVFITRNLAQARAPDLASAITGYASDGLSKTPGLSSVAQSSGPLARALLAVGTFTAIAVLQWIVGGWHMLYEWGAGTALLYNTIAIGGTAYLITLLRPRAQRGAMLAGSMVVVPAAAWTAIRPVPEGIWTAYAKFDKDISISRSLYDRMRPDKSPAVSRLREAIARSETFRDVDLSQSFQPRLTLKDAPGRRPDVIFLVVDSLRMDAYDARHASDARGLRALAFMRDRFVSYTNTWTSYNCTAGSVPALFGGALQAAWYRTSMDSNVRFVNMLEDGLRLAGYRILNAGDYLDLRRFWSDRVETFISPGGKGLGDPGHFLPQIAERIRALRSEPRRSPYLIYAHLFNLHQPLLPREGTPYPGGDAHWMRAMYEHNINYFDASLRAFLQQLEASGALDDTLVVVTSDHGEELYDLGGLYHGWELNPFVLNVPLYVHYPRGAAAEGAPPPGTLVDEPVNLIDVAPTVLAVAGVEAAREREVQGIDLRDVSIHPPREFLALSWQSQEAGIVRAHPSPRVEIVDAVSGRLSTYVLRAGRWRGAPAERDVEEISVQINGALGAIYETWSSPRRSN